MYIPIYDEITFDNFCNIFKLYFKWTYTKLAECLHCNERTLQRWRKYNKYDSLTSSNYYDLFHAFENGCKENGDDPIKVLHEYFHLPAIYINKDYLKVKDIVIYNLNNKLERKDKVVKTSLNNHHWNLLSEEFIKKCLDGDKKIKSIYFSFHSGWDWLKKSNKRQLIDKMNDLGIQLYVIVNHKTAIEKIAKSMNNKDMQKYYIGYNQGIRQWSICEQAFKNLELRISTFPIMRKQYIVNYEDGSFEMIGRNYIYNYSPNNYEQNFYYFSDIDYEGDVYCKEFEFLWDHASSYEKWRADTPQEEEVQMPESDYVLIYRRNHSDNKKLSEQFIISKLSIQKDNKLTLEVNSSTELSYPLVPNPMEYLYKGHAKVTKDNIYINLYDSSKTEQVNISLLRPLHECNRYIGIMNALTPAAHPVAYKCICIPEEMVANLNLEIIMKLLKHENKAWDNHLLVIEENDSSIFYSNNIFK